MVAEMRARAERSRVSSREIMVRAARIELQLEEILDAAADESGFYDLIPVDGMDEPILEFACQLRCLFMESADGDPAGNRPDAARRADESSEQQELLEVLDGLCELAGTSVQLRTTWEDLAARFRGFRRSLIQHLEWAGQRYDRRFTSAD